MHKNFELSHSLHLSLSLLFVLTFEVHVHALFVTLPVLEGNTVLSWIHVQARVSSSFSRALPKNFIRSQPLLFFKIIHLIELLQHCAIIDHTWVTVLWFCDFYGKESVARGHYIYMTVWTPLVEELLQKKKRITISTISKLLPFSYQFKKCIFLCLLVCIYDNGILRIVNLSSSNRW